MKFAAPSLFFVSLSLAAQVATPASVAEAIANNKNLATLNDLLDLAGLAPALHNATGPFTVFAPRNGAFNALDEATVTRLTDPAWLYHLRDVLEYHVTSPLVESTDLKPDQNFTMLNLESTFVTSLEPPTLNNEAVVVNADKAADNGVVHIVDSVLLPTSAQSSMIEALGQNFKSLSDLIVIAGLVPTFFGPGPFTLFVPSDEAIAALGKNTLEFLASGKGNKDLQNILQYHLVEGNYYAADLVDGQSITMMNGDALTITFEEVMTMDSNSTMSLDSNATDAEDISTAVARAAADSSKAVMADGETDILVKINEDVTVIDADILVTNGVIHIIDTVLTPPMDAE